MSTTPNNKSTAMRIIHGTWTHTEGDAMETLVVAGYVYGAIFSNCDASGTVDAGMNYSLSRSSTTGRTTITINCKATVTTGRFVVFCSSM